MSDNVLVTTAYLPPVSYFSLLSAYSSVIIEKEENYTKQTYRNRCYIMSANGTTFLTVPVFLGSFHKTAVKDIRIDYSRRWQQVHLGALESSYRSSPFFLYYFDDLSKIVLNNYTFLLDLNQNLLDFMISTLGIKAKLSYSESFEPVKNELNDYRYKITPKKNDTGTYRQYVQVFSSRFGFVPGLSIVDLLFNMGPDSREYL